MNLNHSVREISYNKFIVVVDGVDFSNELDLDTAADLVRRLENADRMNAGLPLYTKDDMPAILAALAGTDAADARAERDAHTWSNCEKGCTPGGRKCREYNELWEKAHRLLNWSRAPFATIDRFGRRDGHISMEVALAHIAFNGGEIYKAPEGAYEAEMVRRAEQKKIDDARMAERRAERIATGRPRRPRSAR